MIDIIQNNPFRILGVYADASAAEIKRNETKIRRFIEVGKSVTFPTDELGNLPAPLRTNETLDKALSSINLPKEKLYHALFWYAKEEFFPVVNSSIELLLQNNFEAAVKDYYDFIHSESCRDFFVGYIAKNTSLDEVDLMKLFLDGIFTIIQGKAYLDLCKTVLGDSGIEYAKQKVIGAPLASINSALATAKNADKSSAAKNLAICNALIESTQKSLCELRSLLGEGDSQYQNTADALANQILQCGINYFNGSDDVDKVEKALKLQNYALSIAVGKLTRERCEQNVDILQQQKIDAPPTVVSEEHFKIMQEIAVFDSKPDEIVHALTLLDNTKGSLRVICRRLKKNNAYYRRISTILAEKALHNVIEDVNDALKQLDDDEIAKKVKIKFPPKPKPSFSYGSPLMNNIAMAIHEDVQRMYTYDRYGREVNPEESYRQELKKVAAMHARGVLVKAWDIIKIIDVMHLEKEFVEKRFNPNRATLQQLCQQANIQTPKGDYEYNNMLKYAVISVLMVETLWALFAAIFTYDEFGHTMLLSLALWILPINGIPTWGFIFLMNYIEKSIYG